MTSIQWICCGLVLFTLPLHADVPLTAREIIDRVVTQDKLLKSRRAGFDYDLTITREKLDASRAVTSTNTERQTITGIGPANPGTNNASGSYEDEEKKAAREEPFELLSIPDHFNYTLDGEEIVDGVPCYKIGFTPKPDMPYRSRDEKVLNAVVGHIWAAKKDYSVIRNEGSLTHPVAVAWIFASLREMDFHYDTMLLPNGDYGPKEEQYRYLVSILITTLHERDTRNMANYRSSGITPASH